LDAGYQKGRGYADERGFTLPEVLVTIAIMGIIFGIATSSWFGVVEGRRVDAAANQLAADLRLAHTSATNRLTDAQVRFDVAGGAVACDGDSADYCLVRGGDEDRRYFEDEVVLRAPNLLPVGGINAVEFRADGSAAAVGSLNLGAADSCPSGTPAGVPRLQVTVDGSYTHCLTFNGTTSRIEID